MATKKKTTAEKLGLERIPKLTVAACRSRAVSLRLRLATGKLKGDETRALARKWANWYSSKANQLRKAKKGA